MNAPSIEVAPGVLRTEWGGGYFLEGKRDALIAAGINASAFALVGTRDKRGVRRSIRGKHEGRPFRAAYRPLGDDWKLSFQYVGAELEMQERRYRERRNMERAQGEIRRRRDDAGFQRFMAGVLKGSC